MGQSFNKLTSGNEVAEKKEKIIKECYEKHLKGKDKKIDFYRAICSTVEELNQEQGVTQVKPIDEKTLKEEYTNCAKDRNGKPTEEGFKKMMENLEQRLQVTGVGVKDTLFYIFGVPASTTFIKNAIKPSLVSNEVLIPSITSLTAVVLAMLNKI